MIEKKLIAFNLILVLIGTTLQTNLLTELPSTLTVSPSDRLSFKFNRFINGSDIREQVFPKPTINQIDDEKIKLKFQIDGTSFLAGCKKSSSGIALQYSFICEKTKIVYQQYLPSMVVDFTQAIDLKNEGVEHCSDISMNGRLTFVACKLLDNNSKFGIKIFILKVVTKADITLSFEIIGKNSILEFGPSESSNFPLTIVTNGITENSIKILVYQQKMAKNMETTKYFTVANWITSEAQNGVTEASGFDNVVTSVFNSQPISADIASTDYIYYTLGGDSFNGALYNCKVTGGSHCDSNGVDLKLRHSDHWQFFYNYVSKQSYLIYTSSSQARKCRVRSLPVVMSELDCSSTTIDISKIPNDYTKMSYSTEYNLNEIIVSYHQVSKITGEETKLIGYLRLSSEEGVARFTNMERLQARLMVPVNVTHHIMHRGEHIYLYERTPGYFYLKPATSKSEEKLFHGVYLSTYANDKDEKAMGRGDLDNTFIVKTSINSMSDENQIVLHTDFKQMHLYNNGPSLIGLNAKLISGNNVDIEVTLDGHTLPSEKRFVNEVKFIAEDIDDIDIEYLKLTENGSIVMLSTEGVLKIQICDIIGLEVVHITSNISKNCNSAYSSKISESPFKLTKFNIHKTEDTPEGIFLIGFATSIPEEGKETSTSQSQIVWFKRTDDKKIKYMDTFKLFDNEAYCDISLYVLHLNVICSVASVADRPNYFHYKEIELASGKMEQKNKHFKIDLENYGVLKKSYTFGETFFYPGSISKALTINNHENDKSILEIDFSGVNEFFGLEMVKKIPISPFLGDPSEIGPLSICPTFESIFIFSKQVGKIYGVSHDLPSESFLEVPLNGPNRVVLNMICSNFQESLQLLTKDKSNEDLLLLTYFGFDGTQALKKLHSEKKISEKFDSFSSSSILKGEEGLLVSMFYNSDSIFYNQSFLVDLRGPMAILNTSGLVPGEYEFTATLRNSKNNISKKLPIKIHPTESISLSKIEDEQFPEKLVGKESINKLIKWEGELFDLEVVGSGPYEVTKKLTEVSRYKLPEGTVLLDIEADIKVILGKDKDTIGLFVDKVEDISWISIQDKGSYCHGYETLATEKYCFISFKCIKDDVKTLHVVRWDRVDKKTIKSTSRILPFEISSIQSDIGEKSIIVALNEKDGKRLLIYSFDIETLSNSPKDITVMSTLTGGMSLFAKVKFDVFFINGFFGLVVLSPGENFFRMFVLDFEKGTALGGQVINSSNNAPISMLDCEPQYKEKELVCSIVTDSIYMDEFTFEIVDDDKGGKSYKIETAKNAKYKVPGHVTFRPNKFKVVGDFIVLKGLFYTILGEENKLYHSFIYKRGEEKAYLSDPGDNSQSLVFYSKDIPMILYNQKDEFVEAIFGEVNLIVKDVDTAKKSLAKLTLKATGFSDKEISFYPAKEIRPFWTIGLLLIICFGGLIIILGAFTVVMQFVVQSQRQKETEIKEIRQLNESLNQSVTDSNMSELL